MPIKTYWNGPIDFGDAKVRSHVKKALDKTAKKAETLLLQPTRTWQHSVSFVTTNTGEKAEVLTSDDPYIFLEDGVQPHRISGNPMLAFPSSFSPKTTVGSLSAGPGASGGNTVYASEVFHPGIKSRDFTGQVIPIVEPELEANIQQALIDAIT